LSHQRLADESRRAAALIERTANLEMLDGLLNALTGVLDVREVFDRISMRPATRSRHCNQAAQTTNGEAAGPPTQLLRRCPCDCRVTPGEELQVSQLARSAGPPTPPPRPL
jgi:hypothetical protein